ncbi:peptidase U35 [Sphingomonas sp. Leaf17]|uniref:HK97 family phage prohead protease n=1 Tax=Sphingomonas sp. Leaf17 TaxID=1735683 RepID=UPI0006F92EF1|nr:HK97 family phage prohead protease [Sphingomonas sp. Leaf17]KQM64492.1 peptidase U35 [Sphingomonas sp. Leaf17]
MAFGGYAAVFGVVDRAGDVFRAGAFGDVGAVPLLWQHGGAAVGAITAIESDACGLRVEGRVDDARVAALVRSGGLTGLSVGYRARAVRQGARRELVAVDLVEVSLVAVPMQRRARVDFVGAAADP